VCRPQDIGPGLGRPQLAAITNATVPRRPSVVAPASVERPSLSLVLSEDRGAVLVLTLHRPERLNAVVPELFDELSDALAAMDDDVAALVLTGAGRAFCVGGDVRAPKSDYGPSSRRMRRHYHPVIQQLDAFDIPVIAAVNGPAIGAGLSLAATADLRVASEQASFAAGFATVGLSPDNGATHHLVRVLGYTRTYELLLTGVQLDASSAHAWGLVNEVVPHDQLVDRAVEIATQLAMVPGAAAPLTKRLLKDAHRRHLSEQLECESRAFDEATSHPDRAAARDAVRDRIS
jgi:2-(1,2-epoxy-1,2-dihydrophenyl)acetyl-CoA isomerase